MNVRNGKQGRKPEKESQTEELSRFRNSTLFRTSDFIVVTLESCKESGVSVCGESTYYKPIIQRYWESTHVKSFLITLVERKVKCLIQLRPLCPDLSFIVFLPQLSGPRPGKDLPTPPSTTKKSIIFVDCRKVRFFSMILLPSSLYFYKTLENRRFLTQSMG